MRERWLWSLAAVGAAMTECLAPGCGRDVNLADAPVRDVEVRTVTDPATGIRLDRDASPEDVAIVLLKAIRDDVLAPDQEARDAALERQMDVCAADTLYRQYRAAYREVPISREEAIYKAVHPWAATFARYIPSFDLDPDSLRERLRRTSVRSTPTSAGELEVTSVLLEARDPTVPPESDVDASAVLKIDLCREKGYWRVVRTGFVVGRRHLGDKPQRSAPPKNALGE